MLADYERTPNYTGRSFCGEIKPSNTWGSPSASSMSKFDPI